MRIPVKGSNHLDFSILIVSRALKDPPDANDDKTIPVKELAGKCMIHGIKWLFHFTYTDVIGVIIHFFSSINSGIESTVREESNNVIITTSQKTAEKEKTNNLMNFKVAKLLF